MRQRQKGFTLIELLVVIAIISILAAVIVPNISKYMNRAKISRADQDMRILAKQVKTYYLDHEGQFPPDLETLDEQNYLAQDLPVSPWGTKYRYGYRDIGSKKTNDGEEETTLRFYDRPDTRVGFILWVDQYEEEEGEEGDGTEPTPDPDSDDSAEGSMPVCYYEERFE